MAGGRDNFGVVILHTRTVFRHYLTIALRNIRKYALQNTVSMIGLTAYPLSGYVLKTPLTLSIRMPTGFFTWMKYMSLTVLTELT